MTEQPKCDGTNTCCGIYPNCENCNEYDGCYVYGNGSEEREYYCKSNEEGCNYSYSNRQTDYHDDFVYYCKGDEIWKRRLLHDFYCDNGSCIDHTSWIDDQLVDNCNDHDGWYCKGDLRVDIREYRDYNCSDGACTYSITDTQWLDTGNTRNKDDGTICGCTANNTLKACYEGNCTDTGICNSTICGADAACDGKQPWEACGADRRCNSTCNCVLEPPKISSHAPESSVNDSEGATRTFNITINQICRRGHEL